MTDPAIMHTHTQIMRLKRKKGTFRVKERIMRTMKAQIMFGLILENRFLRWKKAFGSALIVWLLEKKCLLANRLNDAGAVLFSIRHRCAGCPSLWGCLIFMIPEIFSAFLCYIIWKYRFSFVGLCRDYLTYKFRNG